MTAKLIAKQWGFSLFKPWTRLSDAEKNLVRYAYKKAGVYSINGPSGWYGALRHRQESPRTTLEDIEEIEPLEYEEITVEDLEDILRL